MIHWAIGMDHMQPFAYIADRAPGLIIWVVAEGFELRQQNTPIATFPTLEAAKAAAEVIAA